MDCPYKRVRVIINPAAGKDIPILSILNDVLHPAGVDWDVRITHKSGDATLLAKQAVEMGVDLVAAYGGDGTQMEVANGLLGSNVPQAILPGGTGNALAHGLNIPLGLKDAIELIIANSKRHAIDIGRIGDKIFMLRVLTGINQKDVASREDKNRLGQMAYVGLGIKFLTQLPDTHFHAAIDGELIEGDAVICYIMNAGSIGSMLGVTLPPIGNVSLTDGYLDIYAITKRIQPIRAISQYIFKSKNTVAGIYHWPCKEIVLETNPARDVYIDGELYGKTPFTATVLSQAHEVIIPA